MKFVNFLILLGFFGFFNSCIVDKPVMPNPDATVFFNFSHSIKVQPIERSTKAYTNSAGNTYKIDLLKYYITNITLIDEKGKPTNYKNYNLINAFDPSSLSIVLDKKIPNGNYRKLKFYMGVDEERNHTGAQEGALSVSNGMLWNWTFGYIFYKLEGRFTSSNVTTETAFRNHLGLDSGLVSVEIPIFMDVKGMDKKVNLNLDIDKVMGDAQHTINFEADNDRQSTASDGPWMKRIMYNASQAFGVISIE